MCRNFGVVLGVLIMLYNTHSAITTLIGALQMFVLLGRVALGA